MSVADFYKEQNLSQLSRGKLEQIYLIMVQTMKDMESKILFLAPKDREELTASNIKLQNKVNILEAEKRESQNIILRIKQELKDINQQRSDEKEEVGDLANQLSVSNTKNSDLRVQNNKILREIGEKNKIILNYQTILQEIEEKMEKRDAQIVEMSKGKQYYKNLSHEHLITIRNLDQKINLMRDEIESLKAKKDLQKDRFFVILEDNEDVFDISEIDNSNPDDLKQMIEAITTIHDMGLFQNRYLTILVAMGDGGFEIIDFNDFDGEKEEGENNAE